MKTHILLRAGIFLSFSCVASAQEVRIRVIDSLNRSAVQAVIYHYPDNGTRRIIGRSNRSNGEAILTNTPVNGEPIQVEPCEPGHNTGYLFWPPENFEILLGTPVYQSDLRHYNTSAHHGISPSSYSTTARISSNKAIRYHSNAPKSYFETSADNSQITALIENLNQARTEKNDAKQALLANELSDVVKGNNGAAFKPEAYLAFARTLSIPEEEAVIFDKTQKRVVPTLRLDSAIEEFQKANHLPITRKLDYATLSKQAGVNINLFQTKVVGEN